MNVTIFADASWCSDQKVGGWGAWMKSARGTVKEGGVFREPLNTSQEAELFAAAKALQIAVQSRIAQSGDYIIMQSDCMKVVGTINKDEGYLRNLTKFERDALGEIRTCCFDYDLTIIAKHVPGHTGGGSPRNWVQETCHNIARKWLTNARSRK